MTEKELTDALQRKQQLLEVAARGNEALLYEIARAAKELPHDPNMARDILTSVLENCDAENLLEEAAK